MADLSDYFGTHPVPSPPVRSSVHPDKVQRNRANLDIPMEPCRYGRCPPGHNHPDVLDPHADGYRREGDEFPIGWTSQNIPRSTTSHLVLKRCILCWSLEANLEAHICSVVVALTG